jgi:DnaK suppressor protein
MDQTALNALTEELTRQRALLVGEVVDTETDLHFIQEEREPELEERAQEDRTARLLARLDDRAKHEIAEIDAALRRIAEGVYGVCEGCGEKIPDARLRALPVTRLCVDCAQDQESHLPETSEEEPAHTGSIPADVRLLSDSELTSLIREHVRENSRIDMEELRLVCRHGVVHLEGALPSEAEHSILRQILTDVFAIEEIVDHVQVGELLWEREDRTKTAAPEEPLPGREPYGTEDIVESEEEGIDYVPPMSPTPEEE